ncbi:MAG: hypothetical protein U0K35_00460, partial [Prevotella sp.]|nr:hypothetical protein [Prevotella sp.]
ILLFLLFSVCLPCSGFRLYFDNDCANYFLCHFSAILSYLACQSAVFCLFFGAFWHTRNLLCQCEESIIAVPVSYASDTFLPIADMLEKVGRRGRRECQNMPKTAFYIALLYGLCA